MFRRALRCVCVVTIACLVSCGGKERTEVEWRDGGTRIWVSSHDSGGVAGRTRTRLHVKKGDEIPSEKALDDDVAVTQMFLVKFGDWILVVNGQVVLGGVHVPDGVLFGENEWDRLPFTVWSGGGKTLAKGPVRSEGASARPARFPLRPEPTTEIDR